MNQSNLFRLLDKTGCDHKKLIVGLEKQPFQPDKDVWRPTDQYQAQSEAN